MKKHIVRIIITIIFFSSFSINAQTTTYFGAFPTIDHSGKLSNRWEYSLYYFAAFNIIKPPPVFFIFYSEQALSFKLNRNLTLTGSYVYQRQNPTENNFVNENRFYVQATYKTKKNRIGFKHRLRYDGRFIENRLTGKTPFTSRLRYLFEVRTPVLKGKENLFFSAYNELFFNTFKNSTVVYSENWAYAGVGYKTKKLGTWELGPLYIFWVMNKQYDLTNLCYLQLTWSTHLDFSKKVESGTSNF